MSGEFRVATTPIAVGGVVGGVRDVAIHDEPARIVDGQRRDPEQGEQKQREEDQDLAPRPACLPPRSGRHHGHGGIDGKGLGARPGFSTRIFSLAESAMRLSIVPSVASRKTETSGTYSGFRYVAETCAT